MLLCNVSCSVSLVSKIEHSGLLILTTHPTLWKNYRVCFILIGSLSPDVFGGVNLMTPSNSQSNPNGTGFSNWTGKRKDKRAKLARAGENFEGAAHHEVQLNAKFAFSLRIRGRTLNCIFSYSTQGYQISIKRKIRKPIETLDHLNAMAEAMISERFRESLQSLDGMLEQPQSPTQSATPVPHDESCPKRVKHGPTTIIQIPEKKRKVSSCFTAKQVVEGESGTSCGLVWNWALSN